ncbi:hypothetical protein [Nesterenkonia ebinurensis]|uniref:hypothetical protein n=1 Tax=Nesterenkonia ebinurensis TaxID=2608252 RepID=UPI00123CA46C|nr:hypothetical protein [Nesterenkonia ebinurensis]
MSDSTQSTTLRGRLRELWGRFVGPEAGRLDHALTAVTTVAGAIAAAATTRNRGGSSVTSTGSALLAADLVGGAYVNNSLASARWYERPGQGDREHLLFAACHIHPAVVAWIDRGPPGRIPGSMWASAHYAYLMGATLAIRKLPRFRRPLGVALTVGGIVLDQSLEQSRLVPWFAWSYYPKLLMGHAGASLWSDHQLTSTSHTGPMS